MGNFTINEIIAWLWHLNLSLIKNIPLFYELFFISKNIHSKLANKWFMTQTPITSYNRSLKDLSDPTSKYKVVFIE